MNINIESTDNGVRAYLNGTLIGTFMDEREARKTILEAVSTQLKVEIKKEWPFQWLLKRGDKLIGRYNDRFIALSEANDGNRRHKEGPSFYVISNKN